jgi:cellulose synthase/poly-beta-1,6-N-acetylglucosamine synthase-like glycosyltransferase
MAYAILTISLFILFYVYIGYGLLLWGMVVLKRWLKPASKPEIVQWPAVTMVIAAYNEAQYIIEKIRNSLSLHYPEELLHILVVTDGSTDGTE